MQHTASVDFIREHDGATYTTYILDIEPQWTFDHIMAVAWQRVESEHANMHGPQQWALTQITLT